MRHILLATTLAAAVAVPALADAQTRCQRQEADNRAAGTVIGAVGGALLGSAIAGRHDRTAGAVVGGIGGAVVGNSIAASNGHCPDGYVIIADPNYPPPPPRGPGYPYAGPAPAPESLRMQEDALDRRISTARDRGRLDRGQAANLMNQLHRIEDREHDMRDRHGGRLTDDDRFYLQQQLDGLSAMIREERAAGAPPPPPPPPPPPANLWAGAPQGLAQRADWLQQRINTDASRGVLTRAGVGEAQMALDGYRTEMTNLRTRDGGQLRDVDRQYLSDRLDYLARRIEYLEQIRR